MSDQFIKGFLGIQLYVALAGGIFIFCICFMKKDPLIATGMAVASLVGLLGVPNGLWMMFISTGDQLGVICPKMVEHSDILIAGGASVFFGGIATFISSLVFALKPKHRNVRGWRP